MGYISEDYCSEELSGMLMESGYIGATNTYLGKDDINVKQITLQSAMKWLREKYCLEIYPYHTNLGEVPYWWFEIMKFPNLVAEYETAEEEYNTYEEACEAAIKYCLENLI